MTQSVQNLTNIVTLKHPKSKRVNVLSRKSWKRHPISRTRGRFLTKEDCSLSSGAPIPQEIEEDILHADELGKTLKSTFIQERLIHGHKKDFFDQTAHQKLNHTSKVKPQGSLIQYKKQRNLAFKLLVKSQMLNVPIDLDTFMSYPLSPVLHCLGTHDGFLQRLTNHRCCILSWKVMMLRNST